MQPLFHLLRQMHDIVLNMQWSFKPMFEVSFGNNQKVAAGNGMQIFDCIGVLGFLKDAFGRHLRSTKRTTHGVSVARDLVLL